MRKYILLLVLLLNAYYSYGQKSNIGFVVEYNEPLEVELIIYQTPLKIKRVKSRDSIDYNNINGLLQSYFSASTLDWAKNEYLEEDPLIGRDSTHFSSVKSSETKDYIQLESVYNFFKGNRKMAYVKYAKIYEKAPFPFISIISLEYFEGRWYISNLLNQEIIYHNLRILNTNFLIDFFNGESKNPIWNDIIKKSQYMNHSNFYLLNEQIEFIKRNNKLLYNEIRDERLYKKNINYKNAEYDVDFKDYNFTNIYHPFVFDNLRLDFYENSSGDLILDDRTRSKYQDKPEFLILSNIPVVLKSKIDIYDGNSVTSVIQYQKKNKIVVDKILKENNKYSKLSDDRYSQITDLVSKYNSDLIKKIFHKKLNNNILNFIKNETGGINIDMFLQYLKQNENEFIKYLN